MKEDLYNLLKQMEILIKQNKYKEFQRIKDNIFDLFNQLDGTIVDYDKDIDDEDFWLK